MLKILKDRIFDTLFDQWHKKEEQCPLLDDALSFYFTFYRN